MLLLPLLMAAIFSYIGAYLSRFEFTLPAGVENPFWIGMSIFLPLKIGAYRIFGMHRVMSRMVGVFDLYQLVLANMCASTLAGLLTIIVVGRAFPRSIYFLDAALCILATAIVQLSPRLYWEVLAPARRASNCSKSILIYGAGVAGCMLAKELSCSGDQVYGRAVGFLDDDKSKHGSSICGLPVLGAGKNAGAIVAKLACKGKLVSEIVIAMPSATAREMRAAVNFCRQAGVPFRTLPGLSELLNGKIRRQLRDVSLNDLLGREPVCIDETWIRQTIAGQSVLVTGGCGSIGSELCRQVARFGPAKLVILDQAESEMYMLRLELQRQYPDLCLATEIGDIVRAQRVKKVIFGHAISVVFHAAAYKHVPLMEENIAEAVENNVIGTYNVAHWASRAGVKKFVLISTDKAVNPTSVMGITKRVAELIVSAMPLDGSSRRGAFLSVRFGNVLGSSGSVIPIFQRQIAAGGPVTVTHPDMRRYFMSISEAAQLVLQASSMGQGSEVFVLEMGEPVRILDLAKNMIRLTGLIPGEDIEIKFTGLRPGEKLFEELRYNHEQTLPTPHNKISRFQSEPSNALYLARWLAHLRSFIEEGTAETLKKHLLLLVPEYRGPATAVSRSTSSPFTVEVANA